LESIVQRRHPGERGKPAAVPVVLITHATYEKLIREALAAVVGDGFVAEPPQLIRIERG
ncbi:MAG: homoserine dehydrogenase, partial [Methylovirgula sp.]